MSLKSTIAKIALPIPLRRLFDYRINSAQKTVTIGVRVEVSFRHRKCIGVVMALSDSSAVGEAKLKTIDRVIDHELLLPQDMIALCQWVSRYYHHPIGEVIVSTLPRLLRQGRVATVDQEHCWQLSVLGGNIDLNTLKAGPKQKALLSLLHQAALPLTTKQLKAKGIPASTIATLSAKKFITATSLPKKNLPSSHIVLSDTQLAVVKKVIAGLRQFQPFLLQGVTGSGKTEVYLQIIDRVLKHNLQALVLVPEISLTPQTVARFQCRFNVTIAVLHSQLNDRDRLNAWLLAKCGHAKIIIGTRLAIMTPIKRLGIIIVDESHDLSYKQQDSFGYCARDVAVKRAQMVNIPVVLGSATPSLESLFNVNLNRYQLLQLPQRAGQAQLPHFHVVDICKKRLQAGLSTALITAISEHVSQGNQVLLFLNRRGFAPTLMCHECGWIAKCTRCHCHLVYHRALNCLSCHHCGKTKPQSRQCLQCHSQAMQLLGVGTERIEEKIAKLFANVKVTRIDRDTTSKKGALDALLKTINDGKPQILIGTQMLAKGHHFPKVTLVGVIQADGGFFSADFRAIERMAQLLIQVAGRAGRGQQVGKVLIQTHHPNHPLLQTLLRRGYHQFAMTMLEERCNYQLPPYSYLALFRAESLKLTMPQDFLNEVKRLALKHRGDQSVEILGPVLAPMPKRVGRYRAQLLLQSPQRQALHQLLTPLVRQIEMLKLSQKVRWSLDVDPMEMC